MNVLDYIQEFVKRARAAIPWQVRLEAFDDDVQDWFYDVCVSKKEYYKTQDSHYYSLSDVGNKWRLFDCLENLFQKEIIQPLVQQRVTLIKEIQMYHKRDAARLIYDFMVRRYRTRKHAAASIECWFTYWKKRKDLAAHRRCTLDDQCPICLDLLLRKEKLFLPCGHFICRRHLKDIEYSGRCPVCRQEIWLLVKTVYVKSH